MAILSYQRLIQFLEPSKREKCAVYSELDLKKKCFIGKYTNLLVKVLKKARLFATITYDRPI